MTQTIPIILHIEAIMPKRFTATEKWDDPWFDNLSDANRMLWVYLLDKCNHAGIWDTNLRLAEYHLRKRPDLDAMSERMVKLPSGKYFIPKFIEFQYGELSEDNRVHRSVLKSLRNEGIGEGVYKLLTSPLQGLKDKDKDEVKEKDEEAERIASWFEVFWKAYPNKKAKPVALKSWLKVSPDPELFQSIMRSLEAQSKSDQWTKDGGQFIPHPSTWLNQRRWEDSLTPGRAPVSFPKPKAKCSSCGKAAALPNENHCADCLRQIMEPIPAHLSVAGGKGLRKVSVQLKPGGQP